MMGMHRGEGAMKARSPQREQERHEAKGISYFICDRKYLRIPSEQEGGHSSDKVKSLTTLIHLQESERSSYTTEDRLTTEPAFQNKK